MFYILTQNKVIIVIFFVNILFLFDSGSKMRLINNIYLNNSLEPYNKKLNCINVSLILITCSNSYIH